MFEVFSKFLPGFIDTLVVNFSQASAELLRNFLRKLSNLFACIVLREAVRHFFLLHFEQYPINTLLPLKVISPTFFVVADLCLPPT